MTSAFLPMRRSGKAESAARPAPGPLILMLYGLGFWLALSMAAYWGGEGYYSLWFPPAGLRLAFLWHFGPRATPAIMIVELLVNLGMGRFSLASPDRLIALWGIVRPVLAYGAIVGVIRWLSSGSRAGMMTPPMPFSLAAAAAPVFAALTALPEALWRPDRTQVTTLPDVITSLTAFAVGDLLGVLLIAPPLLWIAGTAGRGRKSLPSRLAPPSIAWTPVMEMAFLLGGAIVVTRLLTHIGLGFQPTPVILAVAWTGLRFGRLAAWISLAAVAWLLLPETADAISTTDRLERHLNLATIMVVGYLAGSYRDAQKQARAALERRDRLLFQAERLKTLRAMSVAVIHEISQPLSTLAIEARHLHAITDRSGQEIRESAALIDRKAAALSHLVRRLRRFGGRVVDEPSPLPVPALVESVVAIAAPEARSQGVALKVGPTDPDLVILGQEVELSQALMNLLRNAIQRSSDRAVELGSERRGGRAEITVLNRYEPEASHGMGMGVGILVAQAIVEAHGGHLTRTKGPDGVMLASIMLPLAGDCA
ncbi:MASE1 domain-containing protein [Sphingobium baderi]|nr:MASE1 domain-containing protein [Sphingobium baderi]